MVTNDQLQLLTSAAQAIFALGLLIATVVYTYYTHRQSEATSDQIDAMKSQTNSMSKPYLKPTIEHPNFAEYFFAIRNTGNGAAHNVSAEWTLSNEDRKRTWNIPLIPPGEKHRFVITTKDDNPISGINSLEEVLPDDGWELNFKASCEDI